MKYGVIRILLMSWLILMMSSSVVAQQGGPPIDKGGDNFTVDTGNIVVKVTGGANVPFYSFWATEDNDTVYRLQFKRAFEANDNNANGIYEPGEGDSLVPGSNLALAPLSWTFSDVVSDDDGSHFNLSSSDGMFIFSNHIGNDASSLKFDVIINNYDFASNDSLFVLGFSLTTNDVSVEDEGVEDEGATSQISFDDAFFEIEETATDDDGDVAVGLSSGSEEGDSMAYVSYGQFTGQLVHDPTIGVGGTSDTDQFPVVRNMWPFEISKGLLVFSTLLATMTIIMVPLAIYRSKTK